jgi:AsmA protein
MMRALRYIGLALLALLVLAAIAAAVAAWRFDPAWAKQKLTQTVYERTQRTLAIEGVPGLSFFPSIGVRLGKASLSEPHSKQAFASVDDARVSVRVMPLLSRQVVVDRVELDGLSARIVRDASGKFNFDDLLSTQKAATPAAKQGAAQDTPIAFDVGGVAITRSSILYRDEKAGREIRVSGLSLKTGRLSQSASGPFDLALVADGAQPKLKLAVTAHGNYRYDLARKQFAVEGLDVGVKGDAFGVRQLDGTLRAKEAGVGGAGGGGIQITALALKAKGQLAQDAFEAQVDVPRLAQANERAVGHDATASVRLTGAQRQLDAKLKLAATEAGADRVKIGKLDAQWTLKQGPLAVNGALGGAVDADLKARTVALPKLTGELQVAHPQLPMKQLKLPLDATLRVDWGKSQAAGEWSTHFDESAVKGKFQVAKFAPLAAAVDVAIDRLDVDRYLPQTASAKSAPEPAKPATGPAKAAPAGEPATIDFSFLRGLNFKAAMRVGSLRARNLKFSNVTANLVAANGRLDLNPLTADLYDGRLTGSLTAQADGNRVALKQDLSNVAIGPLMKDYARKDILEGRAHITLDVSAAGQSVAAVRQSLNGSASLNVRDGAIKGINLAKSLREYKSMISGGKQDATVADNKSEKTDFSELSASFKITNGVARNGDLALKSPFLRATGAGTIDLSREQLDYLAKVSVVASTKGEGGKELAALNGLTIPVRLTGPIDKPSYHLEFGAIAAELAKQQVQKQLGQQVEKALGKKGLGDVLKGLIK